MSVRKNTWVPEPRVKAGVVTLTITSKDPLRDIVLLVPLALGSVGLEVLSPKGDTLARGQSITFYRSQCHQSTLDSLCLKTSRQESPS